MTAKVLHLMLDLDKAVLDCSADIAQLVSERQPIPSDASIEAYYKKKYLEAEDGEEKLIALLQAGNPRLKQYILKQIDEQLNDSDDVELMVLVSPASARDSVSNELYSALASENIYVKRLSGLAGFEIFAANLKTEINQHIANHYQQAKVSVIIRRTLLADMLPHPDAKNYVLSGDDADDQAEEASGECHRLMTLLKNKQKANGDFHIGSVLYSNALKYQDYKVPALMSGRKHLSILLLIWKRYEELGLKSGEKFCHIFADDKLANLEALRQFFDANRDMLPPNTEIRFLEYNTHMPSDKVEVKPFGEPILNESKSPTNINFNAIKRAADKFREMFNLASYVNNCVGAYLSLPFKVVSVREDHEIEFSIIFPHLIRLAALTTQAEFALITEQDFLGYLYEQDNCQDNLFEAIWKHCRDLAKAKPGRDFLALSDKVADLKARFDAYLNQLDEKEHQAFRETETYSLLNENLEDCIQRIDCLNNWLVFVKEIGDKGYSNQNLADLAALNLEVNTYYANACWLLHRDIQPLSEPLKYLEDQVAPAVEADEDNESQCSPRLAP